MLGVIVDLDVLVHNSGNNWGAPLEEYVSLVHNARAKESPMQLGFESWD